MLLVSGRRAFWLVCLLCPIFITVFLKLSKIKVKFSSYLAPSVFMALVITVAFSVFSLNTELITDRIESSFAFNDPTAESNYLRKEQFDALVNGWKESPLLGAGLGASAKGSVRDNDAPWAYELSYWALLFQTGIVGFLIYTASIIWMIVKSISIIRKNKDASFMLAPQMVSLVCFLIINASNPYLAKFDYLWTIFFPIATLNAYLIKEKDEINLISI
jgi:O-antigen ligase